MDKNEDRLKAAFREGLETGYQCGLAGERPAPTAWECSDTLAAFAATPQPPASDAGKYAITPEWCLAMAEMEVGHEVGAGRIDHPLRACAASPSDAGVSEVERLREELTWIDMFADVRSQDSKKVAAQVCARAMTTIRDRARAALAQTEAAGGE